MSQETNKTDNSIPYLMSTICGASDFVPNVLDYITTKLPSPGPANVCLTVPCSPETFDRHGYPSDIYALRHALSRDDAPYRLENYSVRYVQPDITHVSLTLRCTNLADLAGLGDNHAGTRIYNF